MKRKLEGSSGFLPGVFIWMEDYIKSLIHYLYLDVLNHSKPIMHFKKYMKVYVEPLEGKIAGV